VIQNNELPFEGHDDSRFAVHLADFEIVRMVAEKIGADYNEEWSYKVVHPTELDGDTRYTLVMAKKDIPDEEKPSGLVLP
jgi:hypothetical protein